MLRRISRYSTRNLRPSETVKMLDTKNRFMATMAEVVAHAKNFSLGYLYLALFEKEDVPIRARHFSVEGGPWLDKTDTQRRKLTVRLAWCTGLRERSLRTTVFLSRYFIYPWRMPYHNTVGPMSVAIKRMRSQTSSRSRPRRGDEIFSNLFLRRPLSRYA